MTSMTEDVQILLQQLNLLTLKAVLSFDLKILEVGMIQKPGLGVHYLGVQSPAEASHHFLLNQGQRRCLKHPLPELPPTYHPLP